MLKKSHRVCAGFVYILMSCAPPEAGLELDSVEIINGNVPPRGSLASLGVVMLNGCSGTMIANQFVLTARHCVRTWTSGVGWGSPTPQQATLEAGVPAGDQTVLAQSVIEPNSSTLQPSDYAILVLASPLQVDGSKSSFANSVFGGNEGTLQNQIAFCAGYGNNQLATGTQTQSGFGTLRTALLNMVVDGDLVRYSPNGSQQIQAAGDSGSSCFFNGQIVGVDSTGAGAGADLNNDGVVKSNEFSSITQVQQIAPHVFKDNVFEWTHATIFFSYSLTPPSPGQPLSGIVTTPEGTTPFVAVNGLQVLIYAALRSGFVRLQTTAPSSYVCAQPDGVGPVAGSYSVTSSCISTALAHAASNQLM